MPQEAKKGGKFPKFAREEKSKRTLEASKLPGEEPRNATKRGGGKETQNLGSV
jgi:hypothetical protein